MVEFLNLQFLPLCVLFAPGGGVSSKQIPMGPANAGVVFACGFEFLETVAGVARGQQSLSRKHMSGCSLRVQLDGLPRERKSTVEITLRDQMLREPYPGKHVGGGNLQLAFEL